MRYATKNKDKPIVLLLDKIRLLPLIMNLFLVLLLISSQSNLAQAQCLDEIGICGLGDVIITTQGNNTDPGFETVYVLVDDNTGLVVASNTTGDFTADVAMGNLYHIHILNYDTALPPDPLPINAGDDPATIGTTDAGCYNEADFLSEFLCLAVNLEATICEGDDLEVTTAGNNVDPDYATTYILVDQGTGLVVASNTTGVFTADITGGNSYQIHILNYDTTFPPNPLPSNPGDDPSTIGTISNGCYNTEDFLIEFLCVSVGVKATICEGDAVVVGTSGNNTDPDYTTVYVLVSGGVVVASNTTGDFTADVVGGNSYTIHTLNYNTTDPPDPLPINVGDDPTTIGSTTAGCYDNDFLTEILCLTVNLPVEICEGDDLMVTTTGNNVDPDYETVYVLVDQATGLVVASNTTGDFTADVTGGTSGNNYTIYTLNYNTTNPPDPLPINAGDDPATIGNIDDGCYDDDFLSEPLCVLVNPLPLAPTVTPYTLCQGAAVPAGEGLEATGCTGGTINWYTVGIGGTSEGTGSPFDPTAAANNPVDATMPGAYTFYAECTDANGCVGPRTAVIFNVYALPVLTTVETCDEDCVGSYTSVVTVDLGTFNSIVDGVDVAYTVTTTAGTLSTATISANGDVTVSAIPAGQVATVMVVTGTENAGCSTSIDTVDPECVICPTSVGDFTEAEYQCESATQAPDLPTDAEILATVQALTSGGNNDLSLVSIQWSPAPTTVPAYTGDGCGSQTFDYTLSILCSEDNGDGACNLADVSVYSVTVFPEISGTVSYPQAPLECEVELTMSCPSFNVNWTATDVGNGVVSGTQADLTATATGYIFDPNTLVIPSGTTGNVEFVISNPDANAPASCGSFTIDSDYTCCGAQAGTVDYELPCPNEDATGTVTGDNTAVGYETQVIVTDAAGNILGIFASGANIPFSFWPTTGTTYLIWSYNYDTTNPPTTVPTVGDNIADIAGGCFDLTDTPYSLFVPLALSVDCFQTPSQGNQGGISPFYYNIHEICISGGTPPYSYAWETDGYVRQAILGLGLIRINYGDHATWSVTITDANGCGGAPTWTFTNDPGTVGGAGALLDVYLDEVTPASECYAEDGSVEIFVEGGVTDYTYEWTGPFTWDGSGQGTTMITNAAQGWYTVKVTDSGTGPDANGIYPGSGTTAPDPLQGDQQTTMMWYWVHCHNPTNGTGPGRGKTLDFNNGTDMTIFPNPFNTETTIRFGTGLANTTKVDLYTSDGKLVRSLFRGSTNAGETYEISLKSDLLPPSIYIVKLVTENGLVKHEKLILTD